MENTDWGKALEPLVKKYKGKQHPLDYKNVYQLLVMVILSAQDSDAHINKLAPDLFHAFPDMEALATASSSPSAARSTSRSERGGQPSSSLSSADKSERYHARRS